MKTAEQYLMENEPSSAETALERSRRAAAKLGTQTWELDAEPLLEVEELEPLPAEVPVPKPVSPPVLMPATEATPEVPLSPLRIVESLLFVGGSPLTWPIVAKILRGTTAEQCTEWIEQLTKQYRLQNRPYTIIQTEQGWVMRLKPAYHGLREKLFRSPRQVQLSPAALDVLSLVAYRRPITKPECDTYHGADTGKVLRQLLRLGLIKLEREASETLQAAYGPTPRFLELFHLKSLDELSKLGETRSLTPPPMSL